MQIFVTGVSGYIGSAVNEALQAARHEVIGLAKTEEAAEKVKQSGAAVVRGDLADHQLLAETAKKADAVIHLAMEPSAEAGELDGKALEALLEGLTGTTKPFLYTSGLWVIGDTRGSVVDETAPYRPAQIIAWRVQGEERVLKNPDVKGSVIRPGYVYGRQGGIPGDFTKSAKRDGVVRVVGDGENHWPLVHVDDVANLYVRALSAPDASVYFGVAGDAIRVKEVAEAAGNGAAMEFIPLEKAREQMGSIADAFAFDQKISSAKAARDLNWQPKHLNHLKELRREAALA